MNLNYRYGLSLGHDMAAASLAWYVAYWLRFNTDIPHNYVPSMVDALSWVVPLQALVFWGAKLHRGLWRHASVPQLQRIGVAALVSTLAVASVLLMLAPQQPAVPRSVLLLDPLLLVLLLGGSRFLYRVWSERGRGNAARVRAIDLDELLGRAPILLDSSQLEEWIRGRSILISGAGGTIGAELCRQLARFGPAKLALYDNNEFALYQLEQEFAERHPHIALACIIGDVKNPVRAAATLQAHRPQIVFHAAAYKHVPLMEDENAWEALQNNALGTWQFATAAIAHGVEKFVLVSTDKAVNPSSVMGASKRLAEMVCQALQVGQATQFVIVRFGNVLGSSGSVIPKFRDQIARGGPVTVTHPEITRYFMSTPEAAQLVLQAGQMGTGGDIFVLNMGESVKIVDLATALIRLSGCGESEISIQFTGLRPGEKLYEELLAAGEETQPTPHPKLRIAKSRLAPAPGWLQDQVAWLEQSQLPAAQLRRELAERVPEYTPHVADQGGRTEISS